MKKYITTDKHPYWKEGIVLEYNQDEDIYIDDTGWCRYVNRVSKHAYALSKNWIREIQEPKWTDDDMIELLIFYADDNEPNMKYYRSEFEKWEQSKQ